MTGQTRNSSNFWENLMKRKILSILLAFAMAVSVIPSAFAADGSNIELLEMLPGNEAVTSLFLEILNSGFLSNGEESLQEAGDKIDKAYTGSYTGSGYVANENSYYVSLGDSSVTGLHTGDPAYGNYGYKTKVSTSAPYQVAQGLGLNVNTQYEQLALSGLRTTDLRYVLDSSFVTDEYTFDAEKRRVDEAAGSYEQLRNDYLTTLPKADLITISIGNNNFSEFLSLQVTGKISELLNEELKGPLSGIFGKKIKEAISQYIDLDRSSYKMNWEGYIGAEGVVQLKTALAEVRTKLLAEGVPENYPVNAADLVGLTLPAAIQAQLMIDIPMADMMVYVAECLLYGYVTFVVDSEAAFDMIHEIAPNAELVILSMYNPTDELTFTFNGKTLPYGEIYGYMAKIMSLYSLNYAKTTPKTTFVDIYMTETIADEMIKETGGQYELMTFLTTVTNNSADFHATRAGHIYMKDQILAALAPKEDGLKGDADGSGEVDYLDAMIVLQYHTGIVGDDALNLAVCDVDNSGEVDYLDAMMLLQYHTGVLPEL